MSSVNSPGKGFVRETKGGRTRWVKPSTGAHTAWVSSSNSGSSSSSSRHVSSRSSSSSSRHVSSRSSSSSSRKLTSEEQKLVSQGFTPEYSDGKVRYVKGGAHTAWRSSSEWSKAASEAQQQISSETEKRYIVGKAGKKELLMSKGLSSKYEEEVLPEYKKQQREQAKEMIEHPERFVDERGVPLSGIYTRQGKDWTLGGYVKPGKTLGSEKLYRLKEKATVAITSIPSSIKKAVSETKKKPAKSAKSIPLGISTGIGKFGVGLTETFAGITPHTGVYEESGRELTGSEAMNLQYQSLPPVGKAVSFGTEFASYGVALRPFGSITPEVSTKTVVKVKEKRIHGKARSEVTSPTWIKRKPQISTTTAKFEKGKITGKIMYSKQDISGVSYFNLGTPVSKAKISSFRADILGTAKGLPSKGYKDVMFSRFKGYTQPILKVSKGGKKITSYRRLGKVGKIEKFGGMGQTYTPEIHWVYTQKTGYGPIIADLGPKKGIMSAIKGKVYSKRATVSYQGIQIDEGLKNRFLIEKGLKESPSTTKFFRRKIHIPGPRIKESIKPTVEIRNPLTHKLEKITYGEVKFKGRPVGLGKVKVVYGKGSTTLKLKQPIKPELKPIMRLETAEKLAVSTAEKEAIKSAVSGILAEKTAIKTSSLENVIPGAILGKVSTIKTIKTIKDFRSTTPKGKYFSVGKGSIQILKSKQVRKPSIKQITITKPKLFIKTKEKEKLKPKVKTKTKVKEFLGQQTKTKVYIGVNTEQAEKESEKLRTHLGLFQATQVGTKTKQKTITRLRTELGIKQIQKQLLREITLTQTEITPTVTSVPPVLPLIVPGIVGAPILPPTGMLFESKGRKKKSKKMKTAYTANLAGIFSEKYLKATPKKKTYTGLELRYPVLPKGTWKI